MPRRITSESFYIPFGKYAKEKPPYRISTVLDEDPKWCRWALETADLDLYPGLTEVLVEGLRRRGELNTL